MTRELTNVFRRIDWPLPLAVVAVTLAIGALLLLSAIQIRRRSTSASGQRLAHLMLLFAVLWNGAIVFAFMSPYNRHVIHLGTHRSSVLVNALIGVVWLVAGAFCTVRWYRPRRR